MALNLGEQQSGGLVFDADGRQSVSIQGGGGAGGGVGLTDAQLRATPVPVSLATGIDVIDRAGRLLGHVIIDNASLAVTGPLTDAQLRATAVPVSGTFFQGTQPVSIAAAVPVTDNGGSLTVDTPQLPGALVGGRLDVNIGAVPQVAVNNVETIADNAAFTDGTSKLFPQGYIFDEVAGTALTENDIAAARVDSKRAIVNVIEDATTRGRRAIVSTESALLSAGDTAHDGVDAGNPVKTGAKSTWPAIATPVSASGDRTNNWSDLSGAQIIRKRPVAMYTAGFRLADATAATRALASGALTANTAKQLATIYHTAGATKRVQIKYVAVTLHSVAAVAGTIEFEIVSLSATTAPATGNPAIVPGKHDPLDAAAEAVCLAIPGTQGSVVGVNSPVGANYIAGMGITATASTASPPPPAPLHALWDSQADGDGKDLIMRAATAEGYAVTVRSNAASNVLCTVTMIFTEE